MTTIQDTQHLLNTMPELDFLKIDGLEPIMNLLMEGSLEKQPLRLLMEELFTNTSNFQVVFYFVYTENMWLRYTMSNNVCIVDQMSIKA